MWTTATTSILLASILVSASPISAPPAPNNDPQIAKRSASVVHFHRNPSPTNAHKTSNVRFVQLERFRIRSNYGKTDSRRTKNAASIASKGIWTRALKETARPFDIKEKREGLKGTDQMLDDWEDGYDASYSGPISVGTPYQVTTVQFDTGSSDLVLPVSSCPNCTGPLFDLSKSSTFVGSNTPFSITYEDESGASGVLATDTVAVAGLTVPRQTFAAVNFETEGFSDPYAGILGLGFYANAASSATPFFANLVESGSLESNIFSFYMARGGTQGSELCLGCVDSEKYKGKIEYYPVVTFTDDGQPLDWDIQSTGLSYKHSSHKNSARESSNHKTWKSGGFRATIDTGTTFIYVSKAIAKDLYDQIPNSHPASQAWGDGSYAFPCDSIGSIGKISFGFGGKQYAIDLRDFNAGPDTDGSTECVGGIFGDDLWEDIAVLGDAFMKNWYSVFDYGALAIGFAKAG